MTGSMSVYFNIRKRVFSIKNFGRVAGHAIHIQIDDPWFVVSESGRQRVIKEKRKNVHAYVRGAKQDIHPLPRRPMSAMKLRKNEVEVTYNPYKAGYFHIPGHPFLKVVAGQSARMFVDKGGVPHIYVLHSVLEQA